MRQITQLEELKKIELDILAYVHEFCQKNEIKYSLAYGTLLGAIRHNGFIPWDDDIDIMIPRKDYERFLQSFHHPYYRVYDCNDSSKDNARKGFYYLPFAKVADARTVLEEDTMYGSQYGVYIDVFPIDDMPEDPRERKLFFTKKRILNAIATLKVVKIGERSFHKNLALFIGHCLLFPIPIRVLGRLINSYAQKYNNMGLSQASIFVPFDNNNDAVWSVDKDIFVETSLQPFEGGEFYCPLRYDEYLSALYGDWRKLPPIENRVSHHSFKAWWAE